MTEDVSRLGRRPVQNSGGEMTRSPELEVVRGDAERLALQMDCMEGLGVGGNQEVEQQRPGGLEERKVGRERGLQFEMC